MKQVMPYTLFFTCIGLVCGLFVTQAHASVQQPCTLMFDSGCLLAQVIPLLNKQNVKQINIKTSIARIAIDLNHTKHNQAKIWPYHYKAIKREAIRDALLASPARHIWIELHQNAQNLAKAPKQTFAPTECFNTMTAPSDLYLSSLFCTNLAVTPDPTIILNLPYTKTLPEQTYLSLISNIHRNQLAIADIEAAALTAERIVVTIATQSKNTQNKAKNAIIENYLSYGFNELGVEALNTFTPPISDALTGLKQRYLYRTWAQLFEYARFAHSPEQEQESKKQHKKNNINPQAVKSLLTSNIHARVLDAIAEMPLQQQLKYHRLLIQGFFQSFFNSSAAHDLILAYHLQQWAYKWPKASETVQLEEGLEMLFLEMKIGSLLDHQKLLLIRQAQ